MPGPEHPERDSFRTSYSETPSRAGESGAENQSEAESIFSQRSGIQDPLVSRPSRKDMGKETAPDEQAADAAVSVLNPMLPQEDEHPDPNDKKGAKSKRQLNRVRRRQMNYLQKRREKKKMRVFYGRIRVIFKLCFAVLWAVLLWEMVHSSLWIYQAPRFQLSEAKLIEPNQLRSLIQTEVGKPIYTIHTGKLAEKIEKRFAWVDHAVVRRKLFPTRLQIFLFEKKPWAAVFVPPALNPDTQLVSNKPATPPKPNAKSDIQNSSLPPSNPKAPQPYALMTEREILSLKGYHYQPKEFPNIETLWIQPKTTFSTQEMVQLRELIWQARQIPGLHLKATDVRNKNQIVFYYQEIPVILGRLNSTASTRLARLIPIVPKIQEYRSVIESVDLKWEEQVTFHHKANAQLKKPDVAKVEG